MSDQDRDLRCMERLRAGSADGLEELYDRHTASLLYPVALRILGRPAEAEETIQEAWLQAWRTGSSYDPRRGSVAAWLLTITRSRALDRVRAATSKQRFESADSTTKDAAHPNPGQDELLDRDEQRERVRVALSRLDPNHRRVLEFAYFEGLSQSRIAGRLERPLGTIKSWTREGLIRLRSILDTRGAP